MQDREMTEESAEEEQRWRRGENRLRESRNEVGYRSLYYAVIIKR